MISHSLSLMSNSRPGLFRRCGFTLVEVVLLITISGAMLGLSVTTIGLLMKAHATATDARWQAQTLDEVSGQFRRDAYLATSAEFSANQLVFSMMEPGVSVKWSTDEHIILRTEVGDGNARKSRWHLFPDSGVRFSSGDNRARMEIDRVTRLATRPEAPTERRRIAIEAFVGRDRFAKTAKEGSS